MKTEKMTNVVQIAALSAGQGLVAVIELGDCIPISLAVLDDRGKVHFMAEKNGVFFDPADDPDFLGYVRNV